jgi:hypothetical protein
MPEVQHNAGRPTRGHLRRPWRGYWSWRPTSAAAPPSAITEPDRSTSERERASVRAAFWAALCGVAYITPAHTYRMRPQDHFEYGWEMGRIGRAYPIG